MRKQFTKSLLLGTMCVLALTACSEPKMIAETLQDENIETTAMIVEIEDPTVEAYVELMPLTYGEYEEFDNIYYQRTNNVDGENVYKVQRLCDGQIMYLPMDETVIYVENTATSYYEKITLHYEENGVQKSEEQYMLCISGAVSPLAESNDENG